MNTYYGHTPGPYGVCINKAGDLDITADGGAGDMLADLKACVNAEANAPLFADAPRLLAERDALAEVVQRLVWHIGRIGHSLRPDTPAGQQMLTEARDALALVERGSDC